MQQLAVVEFLLIHCYTHAAHIAVNLARQAVARVLYDTASDFAPRVLQEMSINDLISNGVNVHQVPMW